MSEDEGNDYTDFSDWTKWAITVCPQKKKWLIQRVPSGSEVGDYVTDLCKNNEDWIVGSIFDPNVRKMSDALQAIGAGGCFEDISYGTFLALVEAKKNLRKWIKNPPQV